jgi:hypothetical protein
VQCRLARLVDQNSRQERPIDAERLVPGGVSVSNENKGCPGICRNDLSPHEQLRIDMHCDGTQFIVSSRAGRQCRLGLAIFYLVTACPGALKRLQLWRAATP